MEYNFNEQVNREELESRLNQLKKSMGTAFIAGTVLEDSSCKSEWIVDVTTNFTISLKNLETMNNIMKAFNIIQVWTSGGKDKKIDGTTSYYRLQFVY